MGDDKQQSEDHQNFLDFLKRDSKSTAKNPQKVEKASMVNVKYEKMDINDLISCSCLVLEGRPQIPTVKFYKSGYL